MIWSQRTFSLRSRISKSYSSSSISAQHITTTKGKARTRWSNSTVRPITSRLRSSWATTQRSATFGASVSSSTFCLAANLLSPVQTRVFRSRLKIIAAIGPSKVTCGRVSVTNVKTSCVSFLIGTQISACQRSMLYKTHGSYRKSNRGQPTRMRWRTPLEILRNSR